MKRARKSNRVSWAPGVNLCQVKLFLSEDCPSRVGQKFQDHLQAKTSSILLSGTNESNDLPPGFEGNHFLNQSKAELSCISQIKWKCPPRFVFSYNWRVVAGEESREKEDQKSREMRALEAIYPRHSAIPPSPSVSLDVEEEDYDDNLTPLIPIIPIEEEESVDVKPETAAAVDTPAIVQSQNLHQYVSGTAAPISSQTNTLPILASPACGKPLPGITTGLEADLAAASAVVAAIVKSNEQGSLIDMDLLVRIFNDPIMIEKLVNDHRTAATAASASSNTVGVPTSGSKPPTPSPPTPSPPLPTITPDELASGITPSSTVGLILDSGFKSASTSVPSSTSKLDKPTIPSVPLSRPMLVKPSTPSVPLPTSASTPDMHRPVNNNIHHVSNGVLPALNTQPPQQETVLASRVKRSASLASISSSEQITVPLPSASGNLHAVTNQVRPIATSMPYQPSTGSTFAVKDANYYKDLIRQHGADKQDMLDSQIGIRHSNFQDLKPVHNIKPEVRVKIQKPCIYFNSARGCRNGSNCPYQHDLSVHWGAGNALGAQNAKRLKLGPEIKGRI